MGKTKYIGEVRKFLKKSPVFTIRDIKIFLKNKGYSYLLVSNLLRRGEVKRLTKGFYSKYEDPSLMVFCFKPAYLGLQDALSIHNIWEQETSVTVVTVIKVKNSLRNVFGNNVLLRRIKPKYMFGYDLVKSNSFYLPVSDIEKTLIDIIYFREVPDKETLSAIRRRINPQKLKAYLKAYPKNFRKKVLKIAGFDKE